MARGHRTRVHVERSESLVKIAEMNSLVSRRVSGILTAIITVRVNEAVLHDEERLYSAYLRFHRRHVLVTFANEVLDDSLNAHCINSLPYYRYGVRYGGE